MYATVGEGYAGAKHQRSHYGGDQDLTRGGQRCNASADVHRKACDRVLTVLYLASVQSGPDLQPKIPDRVPDVAGTSHRASGTGEGCEEAVTCGVDFFPAVASKRGS